MSEDNV